MALTRQDLETILETILNNHNVYFQPPESLKLKYPCIIYRRSKPQVYHADGFPYSITNGYDLTVIQTKSDTTISDELIRTLPMCTYDRSYNQNNLYYEALHLYF